MSPQLKSPLARILLYWAVLILVTACLLNGSLRPETPPVASPSAILTSTPIHLETRMSTAVQSSSGTPQPTTTLPYPMSDNILGDICFDFLRSLVGSTIVLDSAADLTALYEKVDRSKKCDDPVTRGSFDFTTQQI